MIQCLTLAISLILFIIQNGAVADDCIPAKEFRPLPKNVRDNGSYNRVHPSGKYVISSQVREAVYIFDLTKNPVGTIKTRMNDEVAPVEPRWQLLASPNHNHDREMRYFRFADVVNPGPYKYPVITDSEHNQYYHSAAEFEDSTKDKMHFRTVLFTEAKYRDYTVSFKKDGSVEKVDKSEVKTLCNDKIEVPSLKKSVAEYQIEAKQKIISLREKLLQNEIKVSELEQQIQDEKNDVTKSKLREELSTARREQSQKRANVWALESTVFFGQSFLIQKPVISKRGGYIIGSMLDLEKGNSTLQIFKIENDKCVQVANTGYETSKANSSYVNEKQSKPQVTFTASEIQGEDPYSGRGTAAYIYDPETKKTIKISEPNDNPSYPGFTEDGRVIYSGRKDEQDGFFIVDPNQFEGGSGKCITKSVAANAGKQSTSTE